MSNLQNIQDVCDYVIYKLDAAEEVLSHLKLQKLLYYVQSWHLAFHNRPLFVGRFEAWVHGPVSRDVYDRFRGTKSLYSSIGASDMRQSFNPDAMDAAARSHIDSILESYAPFSGSELEDMSHAEAPWVAARAGCAPTARCTNELDESLMAVTYRQRLAVAPAV